MNNELEDTIFQIIMRVLYGFKCPYKEIIKQRKRERKIYELQTDLLKMAMQLSKALFLEEYQERNDIAPKKNSYEIF